jgi:tripartite-type tricarboxylate transporter receptor subunit TctC
MSSYPNRRQALISCAATAVAAQSGLSHAQALPKAGSVVKYVVPFPPGGLTDVMARTVAKGMGESLGLSFVVENKAGAGGQTGADQVAKSAGDGTNILAITLTHAANYSLFPNAPFNLLKDFKPVALLASSPMLVVVPANSNIKTFAELMVAAKAKPLNAGSSGNGTPPHLTQAMFSQLNKSPMTHVPYRGGTPSIVDLMGGQLDVIFSNFPESIAHVKSGKLRALALCSLGRNPMLPDVPTALESGMPGLFVENWTAAMMPAATPDAIVERYAREMIKVMFSRDVEERARAQGFRVVTKGTADFGVFLKSEIDRWSRIIKSAKITAS